MARKGHLSAIWINELVGDVFHCRAIVTMHRMDFDYMRKVMRQVMDVCARGAGDATGLGMESCELLGKRYPGRFDEINFASAKPAIGSKIMTTFEDVRQRFPREGFDDVVHDIHGIQKETRLGRLILHETKNPIEKRSHCDMAYAGGLCLMAATEGSYGPFECEMGDERHSVGLRGI